jgi:putative FmdB family regulatory protein
MPTYEYRCPQGHDFEDFVLKISEAKSELPCPTCGAIGARRMSAGSGLLFKGSGFYITDYGKDGKKDQRAAKPSEGGTASTAPAASSSSAPASSAPASGATAAAKPAAPSTPKSGPAK